MMGPGSTRPGHRSGGTPNETARLQRNLLGLRVRVTVECLHHGSHSAVITGPFLAVIDSITLFREVSADHDRWVICEYEALDYVPPYAVSDWV